MPVEREATPSLVIPGRTCDGSVLELEVPFLGGLPLAEWRKPPETLVQALQELLS
jgi:hypothetical protein